MDPAQPGRFFRVDERHPNGWNGISPITGEGSREDSNVGGVARPVREDSGPMGAMSQPAKTSAATISLKEELLSECEETLRRASVQRGEVIFPDDEIREAITFLNTADPDFSDPSFNGARYEQMAWAIVDELKQSRAQYSPDELIHITDNLTTVIVNNRQ